MRNLGKITDTEDDKCKCNGSSKEWEDKYIKHRERKMQMFLEYQQKKYIFRQGIQKENDRLTWRSSNENVCSPRFYVTVNNKIT
jgi:hypothetical protein